MTNAFSRADGDFHLDWKVITATSSKRGLSVSKHRLYRKAPLIDCFQSRDLILSEVYTSMCGVLYNNRTISYNNKYLL